MVRVTQQLIDQYTDLSQEKRIEILNLYKKATLVERIVLPIGFVLALFFLFPIIALEFSDQKELLDIFAEEITAVALAASLCLVVAYLLTIVISTAMHAYYAKKNSCYSKKMGTYIAFLEKVHKNTLPLPQKPVSMGDGGEEKSQKGEFSEAHRENERPSALVQKTPAFWWSTGLFLLFLAATLLIFFGLYLFHAPEMAPDGTATRWQFAVFTVFGAALLAGLLTVAVSALRSEAKARPVWFCPLVAAGLSLCLYGLGYAFLGVWPLGEKSILMVDLHHQYAPLLSELRAMLLGEGGGLTYNFHIGMGAAFIPTFAYYLASPLNLLMVLFPEAYLTEGILLVTLLKGAAMAASFTALCQYLYRRRSAAMVAVGLLYALSGFMLAYSWNIMWLDVLALLPAVVLAMEHMLKTGKMLPYVLLLALALFTNYYIGFMLCIFLVLYMGVWLLRSRRTLKERAVGCVRFAAGSLWGAGLVAALLVPTALALGRTSAAGGEIGDFATNFPLFDLLGRFFYGATPTIRSGNLPNLYCGVVAVLVTPLYFAQKHISLRRRLCFGGLLAGMLFSCTLTQVDLVWHGLHAPNDLPYRFSFLVSFVVLLLVAHVFSQVRRITAKQVGASLTAGVAFLFLWEKLGDLFAATDAEKAEKVTTIPEFLYLNVILLAVWAVILFAAALRKAPARVTSRLLLAAVCAELVLGVPTTLMQMNENEYFTRRADYVANADHEVVDLALRRVEELAREEEFLRMEYLPRQTCVDTALHHYSGLTTFASSNPYYTTLLMGDLGYAVNGVNSYLYHSFVAPVDSLMGLQYVVLKSKISSHPQLTLIDSVAVEDPDSGEETVRYIYRNTTALPIGFAASASLKEFESISYAPFECQQKLYESLTGLYDQIYWPLEVTTDSEDTSISGTRFYMPGDATFHAEVEHAGQYFAFVDCRAAEDITVDQYLADGSLDNSWNASNHEPYIIDMGTLAPGERVEVTISGESSASGNVYIMRLDPDALQAHLDVLQEGGLTVTQQTASSITGTVTAQADGTMFFSIPYDKGWQVLVDGQPAETFPIDNNKETQWDEATGESYEVGGDDGALLGVVLPAGTHVVELSFHAPGLMAGLIVSGVSLLVLLAVLVVGYLRHPATPEQPEEEDESIPLWDAALENPAPAGESPSSLLPDNPDFEWETE